jgi:hypothetical protein
MLQVPEQPLWQLAVVEGAFGAIGAFIIFLRHSAGAIPFPLPWPTELAIGIPIGGVLGALLGIALIRSPLRGAVVHGTLPLRSVTRAALQPWIGLGWAAILFGLAHGGTARVQDGVSAGKVVYLLATLAAGLLLGLLCTSAGLLAAMTAHASFDVGILLVLAPALTGAGVGVPHVE